MNDNWTLSHNALDNLPVIPVDTVPEALVFSLQVATVEVWVVTGAVPPSALEPPGAVLAPGVVVSVHGAELGPLLRHTLTELTVDVSINYSKPENSQDKNPSISHPSLTCRTLCRWWSCWRRRWWCSPPSPPARSAAVGAKHRKSREATFSRSNLGESYVVPVF